ncbi:MAG: DNA-processing protein DprA [Actinomycetaceae bacterium]
MREHQSASAPRSEEHLARAAWTRLVEGPDPQAHRLARELGAPEALAWLRRAAGGVVLPPVPPGVDDGRGSLATSVARWTPRLEHLEPARELDRVDQLGGWFVVPGDAQWPAGLDDLGEDAPPGLWGRGQLAALARPAAGIVGSRASTPYGMSVGAEIAAGVADAGMVVLSGGAYGIDTAAHRGALAVDGCSVAVMAGGIDRFYPAGSARMLEQLLEDGAVVAEAAPGSNPARHRFLARNRLIAAMSGATLVVEAAHRSGALSTARHAAGIGRPVGAVPGPVTSMASAGCHRLMREQGATCVTNAEELLELALPIGATLGRRSPTGATGAAGSGPRPGAGAGSASGSSRRSGSAPGGASAADEEPGLLDGLDPACARVLDALPAVRAAEESSIARNAGLDLRTVRSALGLLELMGRIEHSSGRWRRSRPARAAG